MEQRNLILKISEVSDRSRDYTGMAKVAYPNGHLYDGEFLNGQRSGSGIYTYTLEEGKIDKYEGEWLNNMKHGIGKMTYAEAGEYFGRFENGKRHGEGVFSYKNKDIYSGSWMYGKKHGKGTFIFAATKMKVKYFLLLDCRRIF
jgi:radial spoke head protein 1